MVHLEDLRLDSRRWNRLSAPSLHACARSKQVRPQPQMFPGVPLDHARHQEKVMAPQPWGPVTRACRKAGIQDGSTLTKVQMMRNARSAVHLRFPCEQSHSGVPAWLRKTLEAGVQPERVHCKKEEPDQLESYFLQDQNLKI